MSLRKSAIKGRASQCFTMSPFRCPYDVPVFLSQALRLEEEIVTRALNNLSLIGLRGRHRLRPHDDHGTNHHQRQAADYPEGNQADPERAAAGTRILQTDNGAVVCVISDRTRPKRGFLGAADGLHCRPHDGHEPGEEHERNRQLP